MIFKPLLLALAAVALTGCASMKGPRETATHNLDGSRKTSEEMRLYDLGHARIPDEFDRKFQTLNYPAAYVAAFEQSKSQATVDSKQPKSFMTVAGYGNMGVAVIDRAASFAGGASLFSSAFAGGLFVGGLLAGTNDRILADNARQKHSGFMDPKRLTVMRLRPSRSDQIPQTRHNDVEQDFLAAIELASSIGCSFEYDGVYASQAIIGLMHIRHHKCRTLASTVSMNALAIDSILPNTTASYISLYGPLPADQLYAKIKDKIPSGYVAIFTGKIDGQTKVLVAANDLVTAFDPPPAP